LESTFVIDPQVELSAKVFSVHRADALRELGQLNWVKQINATQQFGEQVSAGTVSLAAIGRVTGFMTLWAGTRR
jgi:hypothetical protein